MLENTLENARENDLPNFELQPSVPVDGQGPYRAAPSLTKRTGCFLDENILFLSRAMLQLESCGESFRFHFALLRAKASEVASQGNAFSQLTRQKKEKAMQPAVSWT